MPAFAPYPSSAPQPSAIPGVIDPLRKFPYLDQGIIKRPPSGQVAADDGSSDTSSPPATADQRATADATLPGSSGDTSASMAAALATPASYSGSNGIGPPPSDAMAKALLQNEEEIPLNRPFEAIGKLGALWGAQHAGEAYNKAAYERQVAPAKALSQALANIPSDTPAAEYRRKMGQAFMAVGGQFGNPEMIEKGAELTAAPTNYIQMKDAANNDYLVNPYDLTDVRGFDANGNLVKLKAPPSGLTPAGATSGTSSGAAAPTGSAAPAPGASAGGDPYAKFRLPRNTKQDNDTIGYNNYLQQQIQLGTPPDQIKDLNTWTLDRSRAGAIQQSITVDPQKKAGDVLADSVAKRYSGLIEGVEGAIGRQRDIHAMQGALTRLQANGGTVTGLGAKDISDLQSAINVGATALGFDQPFNIADKEALSKFNQQLAGQAAKSAAGARVTNFEMANYIKSNPGLEVSPQGNVRLLGIMEQIEQRNIDLGNALGAATEQAVSGGKTIDLPALHKIVADYDAAHHIVDPISGQDLTVNPKVPELQAAGGKTGAAGAPSSPAPGSPATPPGYDPLGILK